MIKLKRVVISNPEGTKEYTSKFPVEFDSFTGANKFLQENMEYHTKGGYDKHNVMAEWEDGQTYEYRADISHPEGNCFSSIEYNIGQRIKQGLLFMKGNSVCEETRKSTDEFLKNYVTSSLNEKELADIIARDRELCEINSEKQKKEQYAKEKEQYAKEWEELKEALAKKSGDIDEDKEKAFPSRHDYAYYKKGEYIRFGGTKKRVNPSNDESEMVEYHNYYSLGDDVKANRYESGQIKSITEKSVMIELREGVTRRVSHADFSVSNDNSSRDIESIEYENAMYRAYYD